MHSIKLLRFLICTAIAVLLIGWAPSANADASTTTVLDGKDVQACLDACNADPNTCFDAKKCAAEHAKCRDVNLQWFNWAKDNCPALPSDADAQHPPAPKPKGDGKKAITDGGKKWQPPQKIVICEGGATKSKDGKYCECRPEGFPARELTVLSHPWNNVYAAQCAPTLDMFRQLRDDTQAKFDAICGKEKATTADCLEANRKLNEMFSWYKSLVLPPDGSTTPPLNWESYDLMYKRQLELNRILVLLDGRVTKVEGDVSAIEKPYCPPIEGKPDATMEERCQHEHDKLAQARQSVAEEVLSLDGGYAWRPNPSTDSFVLSVNATLRLWPGDRDGVYVGGLGGVSWNDDVNRYALGGRLGYARDLSSDRTVILQLGGIATSEPVLKGLNDATFMGGEVSLDWRPGNTPLTLLFGVMMGGETVALYRDIPAGRERRLSDWGLLIQPNVGLGLTL